MGPTISTIALGCSDPEEEQHNSSQAPGELTEIQRTADTDSNSYSSSIHALSEVDRGSSHTTTSSNNPTKSTFNVYHPHIESIAAISTSIPSATDNPSVVFSQISPEDSPGSSKLSLESQELPSPPATSTTSKGLEFSSSESKEVYGSIQSSPENTTSDSITTPQNISLSDIENTSEPVLTSESLSSQTVSSLCVGSLSKEPVCKDCPKLSDNNNMETVAVTADFNIENGELSEQASSNPMDEIDDTEEESKPLVAPSNTPITSDSGHNSPTMEGSCAVSSDDGQKEITPEATGTAEKAEVKPTDKSKSSSASATVNPVVKESSRNAAKESKKDKGSSGKSKKKEDKGIEYILRALNSLQTPEEKLAALCKRYADMHEEHRVLQTSFKSQQRTLTVLMREKDQTQSDHAKAVIAKSKLESLCRELQKQNKIIKDESIQRAKEDDEKRREISAKFQTTVAEIQTQMNSNNDRNSKLQQENMELAGQLKKFVEQYENREQKMKQHRDLEQQVADARLTQAKAILKEEQEKNAKEKELLLMKATESTKKVTLLEAQVTMFKDRYDEFESLHARSNETFQKYKTEMDKMTKRIKRLEKDGLAWKNKWEKTNKALIESLEARTSSEKETTVYVQKVKKLESLCRALQVELHKGKVSEPAVSTTSNESSPVDEVPPNSPETPASGQTSPDTTTPTATTTPSTTTTTTTSTTTTTPETSQEDSERGAGDGQSTSASTDSNIVSSSSPHDKSEKNHQPQSNDDAVDSSCVAGEEDKKEEEKEPAVSSSSQSKSSPRSPKKKSNPMDEADC